MVWAQCAQTTSYKIRSKYKTVLKSTTLSLFHFFNAYILLATERILSTSFTLF